MQSRFLSDRSGATAILFGATLMAATLAIGNSIDLGIVTMARNDLQSQIDSAALFAATSGATTEKDLLKAARRYLDRTEVAEYTKGSGSPEIVYTSVDKSRFSLKVPAKVPTAFMHLMGYKYVDITAMTEVELGSPGKLELALVLDNTYSMNAVMADGKTRLAALKSAASDLVKTVTANPKADVKIAVVPFVDYVNIGTSLRSATWLSVPADKTVTGTETCKDVQTYKNVNCVKKTGTRVRDGVTETYTYDQCDKVPDKIVKQCTTPVTKYIWNGCVGTRTAPNQIEPDVIDGNLVPGLQNVSCGNAITPLTNNQGQVQSAISTMKGVNETYVPSGLLWGMAVLTPNAPYTEARPFDKTNRDPRKVMVVMTDGANTKSLKQPFHNGSNAADANTYTTNSCKKAKALGIEVFTIAFDVTDTTTKTMLEGCATSSAHYFDATGSSGIQTAFKNIGESLRVLRIVR